MKRTILTILVLIGLIGIQRTSYGLESFDKIMGGLKEDLEEGSVMGLGVMVAEQPYEGVDNDVYPTPIIVAEYKQFFIDTSVLGYYFSEKDKTFRFGVIGSPRFQGFQEDDSSSLNGMQDRDWGFDGGLRLNGKGELLDMNLEAVTDLSGTHEGQELRVTFSKTLLEGFLTPRIGLKWQSEDLVDYYYGVRSNEVRAGRDEYEPESALEYLAGLTLAVPLGEEWALIGDVQCIFLNEEVQDSPIVDEDVLMRYVGGLVYRF